MATSPHRPILLATDGSPAAAQATHEAILLARALDAPLVALAVGHAEPPLRPYAGSEGDLGRLRQSERDRATEVVATTVAAAQCVGVSCQPLVGDGDVPSEICRHASEYGAATIVIGASESGAFRRLLDGGLAEQLLHRAPCPVLIVPSPTAARGAATQPIEKETS